MRKDIHFIKSRFMILSLAFFFILSSNCSREGSKPASSHFMAAHIGYVEHRDRSHVTFAVPSIPGSYAEMWCYETPELHTVTSYTNEGDALVLTHKQGEAIMTSRFEPADYGAALTVHVTGPDSESVKSLEKLTPCLQMKASKAFQWRGRQDNQEDYVEGFVSRCFVILEDGLIYLTDTRRKPANRIPTPKKPNVWRANLPMPWVQFYIPIWLKHVGRRDSPGGNSLDRPVYPIIGIVSHDRKYLAAFAWPDLKEMAQFWHDCLHIWPQLNELYDANTNSITTNARIYFMPNDENKLIEQFKQDFPDWKRPLSDMPTPDY